MIRRQKNAGQLPRKVEMASALGGGVANSMANFHHEDIESLEDHLRVFVTAYNLAKHLKALRY
ncbi:hypothetical protein GCM10007874_63950 [Labrys miyagiensis]|uniref:Uncharacterized protein n=1 Tax=Labrys miyagiensis TaxID=346912 RepID=A0ABQ6CTC9_9HYPH|nr:hypothetical protein [Labrys miyagiensis]GLS23375.1 hypothetical protein GCM10007874_63950 [Labrys miyagiensis]